MFPNSEVPCDCVGFVCCVDEESSPLKNPEIIPEFDCPPVPEKSVLPPSDLFSGFDAARSPNKLLVAGNAEVELGAWEAG